MIGMGDEIRHDNRRSHVLSRPLEATVADGLDRDLTAGELTHEILTRLSEMGVIAYAPKGTLSLLTPAGRLLIVLMERPEVTMRELGVFLGCTEANVMRAVSQLVKANIITRTKVKGRNRYRFNSSEGFRHPDITRFYAAITRTLTEPPTVS